MDARESPEDQIRAWIEDVKVEEDGTFTIDAEFAAWIERECGMSPAEWFGQALRQQLNRLDNGAPGE